MSIIKLTSFYFSNSIKFNFIVNNNIVPVIANIGDNLLEVAKNNNINLIGACEGSCACASCHVIFEPKLYKKLPKIQQSEEDMLENAFGVTSTSRLACQIKIDTKFKGCNITIPKDQRNISFQCLSDVNNKI